MDESVLLKRQVGAVLTLTLNRPQRFNALSDALLQALSLALDAADADSSVRALVLSGAGTAFCSGADVGGVGSDGGGCDYSQVPQLLPVEQAVQLRRIGDATREGLLDAFHPLMLRLQGYEKPLVCAVNGIAAGGGVGLALACDIVVAARSARFVQVFAPKLGLIPDCGITWHLPRLIGKARALALGLLGEPLSASDAERFGMIWKVVDDAALPDAAHQIAERLAANPAHVNARIKQVMQASTSQDLEAQLLLEAHVQGECGAMPSYVEGVLAFQQKRVPLFYPTRTPSEPEY